MSDEKRQITFLEYLKWMNLKGRYYPSKREFLAWATADDTFPSGLVTWFEVKAYLTEKGIMTDSFDAAFDTVYGLWIRYLKQRKLSDPLPIRVKPPPPTKKPYSIYMWSEDGKRRMKTRKLFWDDEP